MGSKNEYNDNSPTSQFGSFKKNDHLTPKLIKLNTKLHLAEARPEAGQKTFSGCLSPPCSCSVYARGLKLAAHVGPTRRLHIEVKK